MAWLPWQRSAEPEAGLGVGNLDNGRRKPRQWWIGAQKRAQAAGKIHQQSKKTARGGSSAKAAISLELIAVAAWSKCRIEELVQPVVKGSLEAGSSTRIT
jgi:hypothetical protein